MIDKPINRTPLNILLTFLAITVFHIPNCQAIAQDKIILATDAWAPFYSPELKNDGFFTEITKAAFEKAGYNCEIVFVPWERALNKSKRAEYHGIMGIFYNSKRTQYFKYSTSVLNSHIAFFSKKNAGITFKTLQDLSRYSIGTIRGYQYSEDFDSADYLQKEAVTSVEQNIKKVASGRLDLFIDSKEVVLWKLRNEYKEFSNSIEPVTPIYRKKELYITISKNVPHYEKIIRDFNDGLKQIKKEGIYDRIISLHEK